MTTLADILGMDAPAAPAAPVVRPIKQVATAMPLFDWQRKEVDHILRGSQVSALFADPGLGKTAMAAAVIASCLADMYQRALVVVPASLTTNWVRELNKFTPNLSTAVLRGQKPNGIPDADILVISNMVLPHWVETLNASDIDVLIVDESHSFKDPKSKRTLAAKQIASTIDGPKVIMTGTPVPNGRYAEFVPQFDILGNEAWKGVGGRGEFYANFCPKIDSWGNRGSANGEELNRRLYSSFARRVRRDDVIKLAGKHRNPLVVDCDNSEAREYRRIVSDFIQWLRDSDRDPSRAMRAEAIVKLGAMRQAIGLAKVDGIVQHVEGLLRNTKGGVLIFAEHNDVMDTLLLQLARHRPVTVRGSTSPSGKTAAVDAFSSGDSRVLVGQITSAGVGLTLHGDGLNTNVVMAQIPWTPAQLTQAEDRIYRIGQPNPITSDVTIGRIDNEWTIDERLFGILSAKHLMIGEVMDDDGQLLDGIYDGLLDTFR